MDLLRFRHFFMDLGHSRQRTAQITMATAFQTFVAPAKPRNQIWRLIAGLIVIAAAWIGGTIGILWLSAPSMEGLVALGEDLSNPTSPRPMLILLLTFAGPFVGVIIAAALLHRRGPLSLIGPFAGFRANFARVLLAALVIYGLILVLSLIWARPIPNLEMQTWVRFLLPALALVLLQTGAEELVFRGYMMQQLAARFKSRWMWIGLPSLAFGLMHFDAQAGLDIAIMIVLATGLFGLIAADLTHRTGNLGAAWALHFCNNVAALLIVALDGQMTGLALYVTPYSFEDSDLLRRVLIGDMVAQIITWLIIVRILRR